MAGFDGEAMLGDVTDPAQTEWCPSCGGSLRLVGFFLGVRQDDQQRVCRTPWWCPACDQVWTRWADRNDPLELDAPLPANLQQRLLGA